MILEDEIDPLHAKSNEQYVQASPGPIDRCSLYPIATVSNESPRIAEDGESGRRIGRHRRSEAYLTTVGSEELLSRGFTARSIVSGVLDA